MELTESNLPIYAFKFYTNPNCGGLEEYLEDLNKYKLAQKLAKKIGQGKSENIRLLCNHVICFTNSFEVNGAKNILMFDAEIVEKEVIKTVLNYFGFVGEGEMEDIKFSLPAAKALKEMDK